jgi:hypothetical protein
MSQTRIYVVLNDGKRRLVEATSAAQAIRHCVQPHFSAKPATPREVAALMAAGYSVEHVTEASECTLQAAPVISNQAAISGTN